MTTSSPRYAATVVQLARLGDLAQSWPLIHRLASTRGTDRVALVVDRQLAGLAGLMVGSDNVLSIPLSKLVGGSKGINYSGYLRGLRELTAQLGRLGCERVINLNYHGASAAIAEAIPAKERLGARWTDVAAERPSDPQTLELFAATFGERKGRRHLSDIWLEYAADEPQSRLHLIQIPTELSDQAAGLLDEAGLDSKDCPIAVIPGAGLEARQWRSESFARLIAEISPTAPVVLVGTAGEAGLADQIIALSGASRRRVISICGKTDPKILAAILARCRLAIGVDTGALQLAAAVGTPCLGIYYGSMNFRETGPYGEGNMVIAPDDPSYPSQEWEMERRADFWRTAISAEAVVEAAKAMMTGTSIELNHGVSFYKSHLTGNGLKWIEAGDKPALLTLATETKLELLQADEGVCLGALQ